ncbi:MAG: hypothetical protein NTZ79_10085 [Proteobacteria bacterium]|nr:hypothetical protein [Pseudomonadota bacterium]
MQLSEIRIAARYCGPPEAGNGGYVAGLLAGFATESVSIRLQARSPLDMPLAVHAGDQGVVELRDGATLIATAWPQTLELDVPTAPNFDVAAEAATRYRGLRDHPCPGCFVCGADRADGLRIFAGALAHEGQECVAAVWTPDASLAGTRGRVRPEFLWAALDCPGYFALVPDFRPMLLGSLAGRVEAEVRVGEPCVVLGWRLGIEGRKHRAGTALYGADGRCVARMAATWIELRSAGFDGA